VDFFCSVCIRDERAEGSVVDLRIQIADGQHWRTTGAGVAVPIDMLPELIEVLEKAIEKLPEV
jgi:hypothetical protein